MAFFLESGLPLKASRLTGELTPSGALPSLVLDSSEGVWGRWVSVPLTPKGLWKNQGPLRDKGIEIGEGG